MSDGNVVELSRPASQARDALTQVLREGAQRLLAQAVEAEVAAFVAGHAHLRDEAGRRVVVRNGHLPKPPPLHAAAQQEASEGMGTALWNALPVAASFPHVFRCGQTRRAMAIGWNCRA